MLPSTILMGASLPAIVRGIEATPRGVSWWALLYGSNTAGAVFGCLLAGFYLLRIYNMATAAFVAAAINMLVAAAQLLPGAAIRTRSERQRRVPIERRKSDCPVNWPVYVDDRALRRLRAGRGSGLDAADGHAAARHRLRFLDHSRGLSGGAGGRRRGGFLAHPQASAPQLALGMCQLLLRSAIAWTAVVITGILPFWSDAILTTTNPWQMFCSI